MKIKISLLLILICSLAFSKNLYVSTTGNNEVSYSANTITTPWATFAHGVYNLMAGDTLLIREGVYIQNYHIRLRSDYERETYGGDPVEINNSQTGTALKPVVVKNYQNEKVIIDCKNFSYLIHHDGKEYWIWEGLTFINCGTGFFVGENAASNHNIFKHLQFFRTLGGDNAGAITLCGGNCEHTVIEYCKIAGPAATGVHQNTNGIYLKALNHVKILNCEISDVPIGIYYKHANSDGNPSTEIEIAYNYIENTGRNAMQLNSNYAKIHDNIIGPNNAGILNAEENGVVGGNNNVFEHNTFFSAGLNLTSQGLGSINCVVKNNLFKAGLSYPPASNITVEYNAFGSSPAGTHAVSGTIVFEGGANPSSIAGYKLASNSIGYANASDGKDRGADAGVVGLYDKTTARIITRNMQNNTNVSSAYFVNKASNGLLVRLPNMSGKNIRYAVYNALGAIFYNGHVQNTSGKIFINFRYQLANGNYSIVVKSEDHKTVVANFTYLN